MIHLFKKTNGNNGFLMGKKALRAEHPNRLYNIVLRVRGSMKNDMLRAAKKHDMSLSEYVLYCVWEHIRSERGIPTPGSAQFSMHTPIQEIQAYLRGEQLLTPCGQRECDMKLIEFQNMTFCNTCNVRIE
jgi:hypothetical protein